MHNKPKRSSETWKVAANYSYLEVLALYILLDRAEIIEAEMTCCEVQPAMHHTHQSHKFALLLDNQLLLSQSLRSLEPDTIPDYLPMCCLEKQCIV